MRIVLDSVWFTFFYPILLVGFLALGSIYAIKFYHARKKVWKPIGIEGGLVGIFALLISFTMVVSGNVVRDRANAIHEEAEEISLIYRTCKFYNDTLRGHVHDYLQNFLRIQLGNRTPSYDECQDLIDSVEIIDQTLDVFLVEYVHSNPAVEGEVISLLPLLHKASAKYSLILYSFTERTPVPIMIALIILSFTIAFLVGFMNSFQEMPDYLIPIIFFVITVLMITGIRDLDNPARGLITPQYDDLQEIQTLIEQSFD
jgi:hypothetical protein